jgi:hypothetical protein
VEFNDVNTVDVVMPTGGNAIGNLVCPDFNRAFSRKK